MNLSILLLFLVLLPSCQQEKPKTDLPFKDTGILLNKRTYNPCDEISSSNGTAKEYTAVIKNDNVLIRDPIHMRMVIGKLRLGEQVKVTGWQYFQNTNNALISRDTLIERGGNNYFTDPTFLLQKGKMVSLDWIDTVENTCHIFFSFDSINAVALIHRDYIREIPEQSWFFVRTKNNVTGWVFCEYLKFIPHYPKEAFN